MKSKLRHNIKLDLFGVSGKEVRIDALVDIASSAALSRRGMYWSMGYESAKDVRTTTRCGQCVISGGNRSVSVQWL